MRCLAVFETPAHLGQVARAFAIAQLNQMRNELALFHEGERFGFFLELLDGQSPFLQ